MTSHDLEALARTSRTELVAVIVRQHGLIAEQQATIERLEAQVVMLETRLQVLEGSGGGPGTPRGMPGHKSSSRRPPPASGPRKRRRQGFARQRATPDQMVVHQIDCCPACRTPLAGGWVVYSRQVIEVPLAPAQVIEHQFLRRRCPGCRRHWSPTPGQVLAGQVVGQQRFGVTLLSLIVSLREVGRLPVASIQWYLQTVHGLAVSAGAIVAAQQQVATRGARAVTAIRDQVRASPVVHADETGWREDGHNGYLWTFSTPTAQYLHHGTRSRREVLAVLGEAFDGTLVTDFYAAYNHHDGPHQRCWAHLLRDLADLAAQHPDDGPTRRWVRRVTLLFRQAQRVTSPVAQTRLQARRRFEQRLLQACQPFLDTAAAPTRLCRRIERFLHQLFVFVADPAVPPTNNRAERDLRHQVTVRKISGGTRSSTGTRTKTALATLFGTWQRQGLNPFHRCRALLTSQV